MVASFCNESYRMNAVCGIFAETDRPSGGGSDEPEPNFRRYVSNLDRKFFGIA